MNFRRLGLGLATLLGLSRQGFFIPYRYAGGIAPPAAYPAVLARLRESEAEFASWLDRIEALREDLSRLGAEPPPAPRWTQDWFPRLDAAIAYALIRTLQPKRIVEIGSGHSTRFLARAIRDGVLATHLTAIDPAPRATIDGSGIEIIRKTLQEAGEGSCAGLVSGDVLFIDSSHILMPGTDVDIALNRLLPALAAGVLVHFHDIFLPDAYPAEWAWRGYNEQNAVAPLLMSGDWDIVFASRYVATRMAARVGQGVLARLPLVPGAYETSLWLRKRAVSASAVVTGKEQVVPTQT
ncbi:MAG: class I SAM-dependent methyltransferase [Alphaproteobacteria bacterium]|nr:class I SAM-dependent methyltransferase [Alphaproteobacteria bacterium]